MTLSEWMEREGKELSDAASALACSTETVRRYLAGLRIPNKATMLRIVAWTGGEVTANDFFGIPAEAVAP